MINNNYIYIILLGLLFSISSCKILFYPEIRVVNPKGKFTLEDFDLFTFQLVLKKENCDVKEKHLVFANGLLKDDEDLVYEELYLFMEKNGNKVLYLTTFSHKYHFKGGVFNSDVYDKEIRVDEIDFLHLGYYNDSTIIFYEPGNNKNDKIEFFYSKNDDVITLNKVTNVYPISKYCKVEPYVRINDVFAVELQFKMDQRKFAYFDTCNSIPVVAFLHNGKDLFFELDTERDFKYRKLKNRIKYFHLY